MAAFDVIDATEQDDDLGETSEWLESLDSVVARATHARGRYLLKKLEQHARDHGWLSPSQPLSAYRNSIGVESQGTYPGDLAVEARLTAIMRWNALCMVARANQAYGELGGHIASYASAAEIFEVGFHHFFRSGDLVYFQPHSAPGVYARAFLEGRLTERQLEHYRRETGGEGLSSYPHPWLMPSFWQFPTGSMGIGPISAIYQARFLRYLEHRGIVSTSARRVWGVFGDGEMDEPESIAGLSLAAREGLDNLTFVINCNLQRLDGPVRGNSQIVQELESLFAGAGWNVIKVLWGSEWDALFARDSQHALLRRLAATVDGAYQTLGAHDGAYNLQHFFANDPQVQALVAHMSSADIDELKRGGHDPRKLHAAYAAAKAHRGRPTVILAKTKKGYGMGPAAESRMTAHQSKKLDAEALRAFRDRFDLPLSDADLEHFRFYLPPTDAPERRYLLARREALGGCIPERRADARSVPVPDVAKWAEFALRSDGKEMSTTTAFVRMLGALLKDGKLGPRIVPIVADEARTFGMASLFKQIGIYAPDGQKYAPEDAGSLTAYREARDGQLLEEGISEAGALSSWVAAATSYSVSAEPMLPMYIFYSMFGFQRVGDLIWAAADQRARGFLIGATAGRTTLGGEGLQHQDGSSQVAAAMVPNCRAYDPAFAGELAVILDHGMRELLERGVDAFYYITVGNESYPQRSVVPGSEQDLLRGLYRLSTPAGVSADVPRVELLGSGAILAEVLAAAELLQSEWRIHCDVYSATSFSLLARDAADVERWNRLNPGAEPRRSHVGTLLAGARLTIAATDYVRAYAQSIAPWVPGRYVVLGTDGFGRSDTRKALRRFFEVDRFSIVIATLSALAEEGQIDRSVAAEAIRRHEVSTESPPPWER